MASSGTAQSSTTSGPGPSGSGSSGAEPSGSAPAKQGARRRADGRRTRALLMDAAEELFAANGVEGVSIRSVNAAAGLAPASVHYHFGDKDALVRAVIGRRGEAFLRGQADLLAEVERLERRPTARDVVLLIAEPMYALLREDPAGGARWITVIATLVAAHDERVYLGGFGPGSVAERINDCLATAYPGQAREALVEHWRLASTALLGLLAGESATLTGDEGTARASFDTIVSFVAAGLDGVCT